MSGYPPSSPPSGYGYHQRGESGQQQQPFDPYRSQNPEYQQQGGRPPYPMGSEYGGPPPPHSPNPGYSQQAPHSPNPGYYPPQQPQYAAAPVSPPPAGQYPHSPGRAGYNGSPQQQHQQSWGGYSQPPHDSQGPPSPYAGLSQPQYAPPQQHSPRPGSSQGYYSPAAVKQEYGASPGPMSGQTQAYPGQTPQTDEERGLMGALAGGAAGGFAGHKMNHGFLGALGGAFAGHKLQDAYKDHRKNSRPSSRRSSSSSSSSDDDKKHHHQQQQHQPPPVPPPYYANPPPPQPSHGGGHLRGNFSSSASRISLDGDHDLVAECRSVDGSHKLTSISLNRLLTNADGHFRWSRDGNFAGSARDVRLVHDGKYLEAELRRRDGSWHRDQICLDERIENSNGDLRMLW
ncbi:CVNH domain-containing protein [Pestalotiopsis sp. NC0098]|nr:CVNH domain-containing protein [Pestalotiopsis sp. NC0098]